MGSSAVTSKVPQPPQTQCLPQPTPPRGPPPRPSLSSSTPPRGPSSSSSAPPQGSPRSSSSSPQLPPQATPPKPDPGHSTPFCTTSKNQGICGNTNAGARSNKAIQSLLCLSAHASAQTGGAPPRRSPPPYQPRLCRYLSGPHRFLSKPPKISTPDMPTRWPPSHHHHWPLPMPSSKQSRHPEPSRAGCSSEQGASQHQ